ncbi:MAG: hypothetical protein K1X74_06850 [Pirellulales bacterium]|nr:hypothetical protein [Pirellulales bacterium]
MNWIYVWPTWPLVVLLLALMFVCDELGFWLGRSRHRCENEDSRHVSSTLKASVFGLSALLLGFTFSMTAARHDVRRRVVLDEANALGTCYLRAGLLDGSAGEPIRQALASYLAARLHQHAHALEPQVVETTNREIDGHLDALWRAVSAAAKANQQLTLTSMVVPAANAVIDLHATRTWAVRNHVPPAVLALLVTCTLVSSVLIGHSSGQVERRHAGLWVASNVLLALVLFVVLDFDRPARGMVRVDHQPLFDLQFAWQASSGR